MIFRDLHPMARAVIVLAATSLTACAAGSPPPPSGGGEPLFYDADSLTEKLPDTTLAEPPDTSLASDYDRLFLEIHTNLVIELNRLESTIKSGTRLAEIHSLVKTAEEFYLEGKPLIAIKLLTEAEILLRQVP